MDYIEGMADDLTKYFRLWVVRSSSSRHDDLSHSLRRGRREREWWRGRGRRNHPSAQHSKRMDMDEWKQ